MRTPLIAACALASVVLGAPPAAAQSQPSLDVVLQHAAAYVADFHRQLSSIVAEERYVQDWLWVWGRRPGESQSRGHRVLLSNLLLLKPNGAAAWMELRDVFEVDGSRFASGNKTHSVVLGRATYGRFRQFQVNVNEQFLLKK